ncbi:MAG: tRNA (adenosine(37)-N6)-threonylcarbamoyltransferase complex ATPase subunit type 1 TsaE [Actinomycetota bacterium]|nr:tRNA (adenosine(37)-N6)-threonylcarbamoyltransferase complex ATPase subunit type 1 TsaE [Actinomycetota bacterium]
MTLQLRTADEAETRAVGRRLAGLLRVGDVVLLAGGLGAGKTLFTGGMAEGLGVQGPVTSPTFVLLRRYDDGFLPVVHADAYRLGSLGELEDLDLFEEARDGVLVIEWGQAVADAMPSDHLVVHFEITGPSHRVLYLVPRGSWKERPLEELAR